MTDYIDRNALLDALIEEDAVTISGVVIINRFPPADVVERKRGTWKQIRVGGFTPGGNSLSVCSECGWEFGTHRIYPDYNYCPNCGADMRGET